MRDNNDDNEMKAALEETWRGPTYSMTALNESEPNVPKTTVTTTVANHSPNSPCLSQDFRSRPAMRATAGGAVTGDNSAATRTPYVLLWAFLTLLWSIFTPPHATFAAQVLLFQPLWGIRIYVEDTTWVQDLVLFLSLHAVYSCWTGTWRLLTPNNFKWIDLNDHDLRVYIQIFALLGVCGLLAGYIVHRGHQLKSSQRGEQPPEPRIDEQILPPLLLPSRTSHSRTFPKRHTFSYSYLFVGVPVAVRGRISDALSVDSQRKAWFNVSSADHLSRGGAHLGLAGKLKRYLQTQGVTNRDYAFAYLVTAPRFLGYSFNPVSFWYLYDSDTVLKYMILEVNNTFDERRVYILRAESAKQDSGIDLPSQLEDGSDESTRKMVFTETWEKDFHVSPFNSRKGSYSIRATDPLAAFQETGRVKIDNTIVLRASKGSAKMVARVWSEGMPKDATHFSSIKLINFIASWWWVGFATFPRIVWEAQKLFFQRKLHVWYRPEVAETSIGRNYTDDEIYLEKFFRLWLEDAVGLAEKPLRLIYKPAHGDGEELVMYSPGFTFEEDYQHTLTIQILSPAFYCRFVHYAHAKEAFDRECLATDEKNRTLAIKMSNALPVLLDAMQKRSPQDKRRQGFLEQVRWSWLRRLRCPPPAASYIEMPNPHPGYDVTDIRTFNDSEIDEFIKQHCEDAGTYRRTATKLFLAQRFALGAPTLVAALDWLLRGALLLASMYCTDRLNTLDVLMPRALDVEGVWTLSAALVLSNSVHLWSFIKG